MARVWKVGSRWSDWGDSTKSVKDFFIQYNIFIVGGDKARLRVKNEVKIGDIVALGDGLMIIAVGIVESNASELRNFYLGDKVDHLNGEIKEEWKDGWPMAVRTRFYTLNLNDQFKYSQGQFFEVRDTFCNKKIEFLYSKYSTEFSIVSKESNLVNILKEKFEIPVYQRPYSWDHTQIEKFIKDIFNNYWGFNKDSLPQPMFIGTMQLSAKPTNEGLIEVIDGQQRLTTFLILQYLIQLQFCKTMDLEWLQTKVNNGSQQIFLEELLRTQMEDLTENTTNMYIRNAFHIKTLLNQLIEIEPDILFEAFNVDNFIQYLNEKVIFVQIRINAGLSKTLQIFDTINTSGLSLAGSDIFKLRMYEYMERADGAFERISEVYERIERYNNLNGRKETDINGILMLYQNILISKYDMPTVLHDYSQDRFFDELFETKFKISQQPNFSKAKEVVLDLEEIKRLIDVRFQWISGYYNNEQIAQYHTAEDYCLSYQIGWSRYSRYWILRFMFSYRFPDEVEKLPIFMKLVSKYLMIYSILFDRTIYHAHGIIRQLMRVMFKVNVDADTVIDFISSEIHKDVPMKGRSKESIINVLNNDIVYSAKKKNLVCRLSAMFDEEEIFSNQAEDIKLIVSKIYLNQVDIEHIHSTEDSSIIFEQSVQNGIGNLVLLEYKLNRSLGKEPYSTKRPRYLSESSISSVKKIADKNFKWTMDEAIKRRDIQIQIIIDYLHDKLLFTKLAARAVPLDDSDMPNIL